MITNYKIGLEEYAHKHFPEEFVKWEFDKSREEFDKLLLNWDDVYLKVLTQWFSIEKKSEWNFIYINVYNPYTPEDMEKELYAFYKIKSFDPEHGAICSFVEYWPGFQWADEVQKNAKLKIVNKLKNACEDIQKLDGYGGKKLSMEEFLDIVQEAITFLEK